MNEAFLAYIAEDGVLLRPDNYLIEGREKVKKFFEGADFDFTLTWFPTFADISSSGDLGYTYGLYELKAKDENGNEITSKGTYVTIWKKDKDGKWKFVLDTGNSGLEPKK